MSDELSHKEKLVMARLLEVNLDESAARKIAIAQVQECGLIAMSPADIDIHCPGHGLNFDEMIFVSDLLEDILERNHEPVISCPICSEESGGTISERGLFLLGHRAFHLHEMRMASMIHFGEDGVEFDDDDTEIEEDS
jgi:hypothetical protein